jgi:hypothetical protein
MKNNSPLKIIDPAMLAANAPQIIGGVAGIASGIIGSKKRRAEQQSAQQEYNMYKAQLESRDTSNPYTLIWRTYMKILQLIRKQQILQRNSKLKDKQT